MRDTTKNTTSKKPALETNADDLTDALLAMEDKWKRALADYQNLEKRMEAQRKTFVTLAQIEVMRKILPLLDDLGRAAAHVDDDGVAMVHKQFLQLLENEDVKPIATSGGVFDAMTMECVDKHDEKGEVVVEVVRQGYMLGEMVIRPAQVIVGTSDSKRSSNKKQSTKEEK